MKVQHGRLWRFRRWLLCEFFGLHKYDDDAWERMGNTEYWQRWCGRCAHPEIIRMASKWLNPNRSAFGKRGPF